jgi:Caspase domain/Sel1 repeat
VTRSSRPIVPALLFALAAAGAPSPATAGAAEVRHPEDLFVVDCLLPAKVRSLGRMTKFAAPRRVARLSAHECSLRGGEFSRDPEDNAYALQAWLDQAEGGDAEAMNNVGEIYEQGVRGAPDYARAAEWYRKAAEAGSRRAQTNLAALYEQGKGVGQDAGAALAWYRRAAGMTTPVDLAAQKEIDALRAELERARGEAADARDQLDHLRGELEGARADLAAAERRAEQLGSRADAAARDADAARAEAERAKREGRAGRSPAPELAEATAAVATKRQKVAELEAAQERYRRLLGELEAQERSGDRLAALQAADLVGKPGPSIQFVRPDVLATRGPSLAPLPADGSEVEVVGRVEAPLGLASLLADGRAVTPDARGWFQVRLPAHAGSTVRFVALDRASRKAEAEIQFVRPAVATAPAASPAAAVGAARPAGRRAFALVVADGAYRSLAPLATAKSDGEAIAEVLRDRFGYQTTLLADATFLDTMRALTDLGARLRRGDDLLVYFAGHGRLAADGRQGYWLPVDAAPDDASTWIPNQAIARLLGTFAADRILVISDSCYAGTLAGGGLLPGGPDAPAPAAAGDRSRSRLVLTSGGLQPVLDQGGDGSHSIFARALLTVLQLAERPLSAGQIAAAVAARVSFKAGQLGLSQTPELAPIRAEGHEAGDFVLAPVTAGG